MKMMKRALTILSFLFIATNCFAQSGYILPWQCGNTYTCTQGNNGTTSHTGTEAYAFDFNLPLNTPVIAMRAGVITHVTESFANNNCPYPNCSSCINDVNRIVVDHGNGTYGLYLHLSQNGSIYNVGDAVSQGQVIGYSGNSGCTTGAHLHVMLMNSNNCGNSWWCQSIPLSFDNV